MFHLDDMWRGYVTCLQPNPAGEAAGVQPVFIEGGSCLIGDTLEDTSILVADGEIAALGGSRPAGALLLDAKNKLVLPGMVDIHGDAFERQMMPRPNVGIPPDIALTDTDAQLVAGGITTAFHGLTLSWEPGLRSVEGGARFVAALNSIKKKLCCDHHLQIRWETFAFEAVDTVKDWLASDMAPALAFNDHTSSTVRKLATNKPNKLGEWAARAGLSEQGYIEMVHEVWDRQENVPEQIETLSRFAQSHGRAMLSHDDDSLELRQRFRDVGARVAEFPMSIDVARDARSHDEHIVLGAPNVVRGGSHNGALNAAECIDEGLCTVLASDYYYPAMLAAVFKLVADGRQTLDEAWPLVSENPAQAMNLDDRGRLSEGARADVIIVDAADDRQPRVAATITGGTIACVSDQDVFGKRP
ncbi:MAG: alpha-D-ribose 1-methylphosphonate 5-triphosphate diphosphatase [Hyphomicrobiaceae bacterium]|nr:alpha-D-ribose 1-methylphosphonate 5-triphosphate diphosphatase [Hyphomicrobiaceae bacterium]